MHSPALNNIQIFEDDTAEKKAERLQLVRFLLRTWEKELKDLEEHVALCRKQWLDALRKMDEHIQLLRPRGVPAEDQVEVTDQSLRWLESVQKRLQVKIEKAKEVEEITRLQLAQDLQHGQDRSRGAPAE